MGHLKGSCSHLLTEEKWPRKKVWINFESEVNAERMGICNPLEIVTVHEILKVKVVVSFSDNMTKMLELKTWNSNPDFSIRFSLEGLTNGHGFLKNDKYDSPDNDKTLFKINLHYNTDKTYYFLKIIFFSPI